MKIQTDHRAHNLPSLQLIRAIAVILVVLYHASIFSSRILNYQLFDNFFRYGFLGVDIFFVLSGFIIFYIHQKDFNKKSSLLDYLIKRLTRIYPLYWLITALLILFYFLLPRFGNGYERSFETIIQSLLLLPQNHDPIISVAWTLSHEIKFYLFFGLIIYFGFKKILPLILLILLSSLIILYLSISNNWHLSNIWFNFLFSPYNLEFFMGCLSGFLIRYFHIKWNPLLLILGLLLFILNISFYLSQNNINDYFRIIFFGLPSFLIISSFSLIPLSIQKKIPSILLFIGDASYSIYLTHQFFIAAIGRSLLLFHMYFLTSFIVISTATTLSLIFGLLIHIYLERSMIKLSKIYMYNFIYKFPYLKKLTTLPNK